MKIRKILAAVAACAMSVAVIGMTATIVQAANPNHRLEYQGCRFL